MDKRSILAVVLIFMLLYVYQTFFVPMPQPVTVPAGEETGRAVTSADESPTASVPEAQRDLPAASEAEAPASLQVDADTRPLDLHSLAVSDVVWRYDRRHGVAGWNLTQFAQDPESQAPVEFFGFEEAKPGFRFWAGKPAKDGDYARNGRTLMSTMGQLPLRLAGGNDYRFSLEATSVAPFQVLLDKFFAAKGRISGAYGSTGFVYVEGGEVKHQKLSDLAENGFRINSSVSWVGVEGKYFLMLFRTDGLQIDVKVQAQEIEDKGHLLQLSLSVVPKMQPLGDGTQAAVLEGYLGPKNSQRLQQLAPELDKLIDFGMFSVVARPMLAIMHMVYNWFGNWGLAIILLTVLIKTLLFPLQMRFTESMYRMQGMKPKIEALKAKFKDDKMRLNQEMAAMYKQEGVNPLGGCLPMFLQLPIFIALYNVLYTAIELRQAPFLAWITDLSQADLLFQISIGGTNLPFRLLPILMAVTSFIQTKLTPTSVDNEQQKMMMTWMPIIFTFLFYSLPSGLMLYWLTQNTITILQNIQIKRRMIARGLLKV